MDYRIHRGQLHLTLGLPDKLPADFTGTFHEVPVHAWWKHHLYQGVDYGRPSWGSFTIVVRTLVRHLRPNGKVKKSSTHRVFAACKCGRLIPVGRMHQHYNTKECI